MNIFYFMIVNIVIESHALKVQPSASENNILVTASAIRNTTNELFLAFKLKGIKTNPKLRQYSLINNYFTTLSSKDHDTLNQIAIKSKTDSASIDNETRGYIDAINELLNEDPIKIEESNKESLTDHISHFLTKLEYLKDNNGVNDNNFNINSQILNILPNDDLYNATQDKESDENDSLLSANEFWVPEQSGRRIYDGDKTKVKHFPFMASIHIFNNFQCGGCIIKSDLIITAASCLQLAWNNRFFRENPVFLSVRIGSNFYRSGGEIIEVLEVYFHPDYNPKTLKNNICLLRLIRKIKFKKKSRSVKKIDFDRNPSNMPMTTDGITIVGWGAKGSSNIVRDPWSNQLSFSVLDIYPLRECQGIYSREYVFAHKNFCAGFFSKGGGACNGDVGGPGIVNGLLAGIVSFGSPVCGTPDAPTVFTKLGYYTDWIERIMEKEVPEARQRTTLRPTAASFTIPRYDTLKTTTFVLKPIVGKLEPIAINKQVESLRILDDENLFKEFLSTMFGSKEAKDYEERFVNKADEEKTKPIKRQKKSERHDRPISERHQTDGAEFVTKTYEDATQPYPFTVLDNNSFENMQKELTDNEYEDKESKELPDNMLMDAMNKEMHEEKNSKEDDEIERNLLKLIANLDDSDEETFEKEPEIENTDVSKKNAHELPMDDTINIPRDETLNEKIDDSVMTLLHLSDSEQTPGRVKAIDDIIEDFDDQVHEGLSIEVDGFRDLTFRDNGTGSFYNFLSKEEMYKLLAEAIDEVAK